MTDIALVQTPPWGIYAPPLGIAYLSSNLKERGFDAAIFDLNVMLYNSAQDKNLWDFGKKDEWNDKSHFTKIIEILNRDIDCCIKKMLSVNPLVIGLSVNQNSLLFSLELARRIKQIEHKLIIAGGWGCYNKHERDILCQPGLIDGFVIGEGEESLCELIHSFKNNKTIEGIKGVAGKSQDGFNFLSRPIIKNLDSLPFPTYEEFDFNNYLEPVLCLLSSRGCIGKCAFCNDRVYQGKFRCRSPRKIVQEIEYHLKNNDINNFSFNDLLINGDLAHLDSWCSLIIEKKFKIKWTAQAVIRMDMDLNLLYKMKKAGCEVLQFGIESGSDRILRKMKKWFNISEAKRILAFTRKAGIETWINFIVGFPGEQEKDFRKTINFVKRNRENIAKIGSVNACNVVFNSDLMNYKENYGIILSDKPEYLELTWRTADGNHNELRKERVSILTAVCKKLKLPINQSNLLFLPKQQL